MPCCRLVSDCVELKNKSGEAGYLTYTSNVEDRILVGLRAIDGRQTAPDYSVVKGTWKPNT